MRRSLRGLQVADCKFREPDIGLVRYFRKASVGWKGTEATTRQLVDRAKSLSVGELLYVKLIIKLNRRHANWQ